MNKMKGKRIYRVHWIAEQKYNTTDVPNILLNVVNILSGNIAGGALLTNALYGLRFVGMIDESKDRRFN